MTYVVIDNDKNELLRPTADTKTILFGKKFSRSLKATSKQVDIIKNADLLAYDSRERCMKTVKNK